MSVYEIPTLYCGIMREKKPIKGNESQWKRDSNFQKIDTSAGKGYNAKIIKKACKAEPEQGHNSICMNFWIT